jgi:CheY-like chemotaxis protein
VEVAENGAAALDRLTLRRPAIIISDVVMPVMDGYEFCRRVKAVPDFSNIPVILFIGLTEPQDIFKGLESGADYYNGKPRPTWCWPTSCGMATCRLNQSR